MSLFKYQFSRNFRNISKVIIASFFTGGVAYIINENVPLNYFKLSKSILHANTTQTNSIFQMNLSNVIADVVENAMPSFVMIRNMNFFGICMGSGVIVDESGYILTNAHVTENPIKVTVKLNNEITYTAKVVAVHDKYDLALIKIDVGKYKLPYMKFADISKQRLGDFIIGIGNPCQIMKTASLGIISEFKYNSGILKIIGSTQLIKAGCSGGPIINLYGEIVSVACIEEALMSESIPSNICNEFVSSVIANPFNKLNTDKSSVHQYKNEYPSVETFIGINIKTLTPEMAAKNRIDNPTHTIHPTHGILVHNTDLSIFPDYLQKYYNIMKGDIICSLNGRSIHTNEDFVKIFSNSNWFLYNIVLIRNGERQRIIYPLNFMYGLILYIYDEFKKNGFN